ncbi:MULTISPECIES: trans-aconitate 2-methyltransferase [unclassified Oceanispirochaeta]|uniref:class I SAM-dependent methyltransferase n=1 Tax=unclassified Oceanispirochaeta TaxID=2635722 RepID=UPI000E09764D|nr:MULTISPECIES: class I SAM-dependent methyltransferase [unclassified Oceanispirochaeta]MBF9016285.1 class I SAM-dependent methyltransferase [Oceanispirochaeta sp. M2]NPD72748.1 class I SAM-dependent methyltransferase [Oceanispirochaeta sp. M1]RDG31594.1 class I SAM-dependent methyltransferase [Oceanispirochaeta sp. M1]
MEFFKSEKNVEEYISMAAGSDGQELIDILKNYLPSGASVLEIGMGPGVDLDILKKDYKAAGSDYSQIFLDKYLKRSPDSDLFLLDAVTLDLDRSFDALYSNKVLHHLKRDELILSFERQAELLNSEGILCHSFWRGEKQEEFRGLFFQYYLEEEIQALLQPSYTILKTEIYTEFEDDDSFLVIARKKG